MATLYKLTDHNNQTYGKTQWGENITHEATGNPTQDLCSDGWIHAYEHPLLAVLLNPIHAAFTKPKLWLAEGTPEKRDGLLKCGCRKLTTLKELPLPQVTTNQRVAFAILCALETYKEPTFQAWANNWLNNKDRSGAARAEAAARAADWAAEAAARAADWAAWAAAGAAARAAAEAAAAAAWAAARAAARAAAEAAAAAAWAAARAAAAAQLIDLAKRAVQNY